jgi:dGTPase
LKLLAADHRLSDGFEGNAQSFRIVTRLAELGPSRKEGLDLTRASLNAVLKYPWIASARPADSKDKYGAYDSDRIAFDFARELGPAPNEQCVEAQIMDLADDIAYSVHDIDDFYRAGVLPLDQLATDQDLLLEFVKRWENEGNTQLQPSTQLPQLKNLLDLVRLGLPYTGTRAEREGLRAFTASQIGLFVSAVSIKRDATTVWSVQIAPRQELEIQFLKRLVWDFVISNPRLASMQTGHRCIVRTLFDVYLEAIEAGSSGHRVSPIPPLFRQEAEALHQRGAGRSDEATRLAIDIVASLGDEQATQMAHRLTGVRVGNLGDQLGL